MDVHFKPLPDIPQDTVLHKVQQIEQRQQPPTTLTIESRKHLERIVLHVLTETGISTSDEGKDAWTQAILRALDELGASIRRGSWLEGLRQAVKARSTRSWILSVQSSAPVPATSRHEQSKKRNTEQASSSNSVSSSIGDIQQDGILFPSADADNSRTYVDSSEDFTLLEKIRELLSKPAPPSPQTSSAASKHLLLCVAPLGSRVALPHEDEGYSIIQGNIGCIFTPNLFPVSQLSPDAILCGLRGWNPFASQGSVKIVGGTFAFKGVTSPSQHALLLKVLHVAVYVHLSLILEQHYLADSCAELKFPPATSAPYMTRHISHESSTSPPSSTKQPHVHSSLRTGILSFFTRSGLGLSSGNNSNRTSRTSFGPNTRASGSLDINRETSIASLDSGNHFRRFSFISSSTSSDVRSSLLSALSSVSSTGEKPTDPAKTQPFQTTLSLLTSHQQAFLFSSSPLISVAPPPIIQALALIESRDENASNKDQRRRLNGDEKAALSSVKGWAGRDDAGKSITGTKGLVRMQELSVLVVVHVREDPEAMIRVEHTATSSSSSTSTVASATSSGSATPTPLTLLNIVGNSASISAPSSSETFPAPMHSVAKEESSLPPSQASTTSVPPSMVNTSRASTPAPQPSLQSQPPATLPSKPAAKNRSPCTSPRWLTYRFYASKKNQDISLGEAVSEFASAAMEKCDYRLSRDRDSLPSSSGSGCRMHRKGEHDVQLIHNRVKVNITVKMPANVSMERDTKQNQIEEPSSSEDGSIWTWLSCRVCGKTTTRTRMSDGSYLLSFAKFIELLIYSPLVCSISPPLCEHTTPPSPPPEPPARPQFTSPPSSPLSHTSPRPNSSTTLPSIPSPKLSSIPEPVLPDSRFNIKRHFLVCSSFISPKRPSSSSGRSLKEGKDTQEVRDKDAKNKGVVDPLPIKPVFEREVVFDLEKLENIFEIRVPRIQIIRGGAHSTSAPASNATTQVPTPTSVQNSANLSSADAAVDDIKTSVEDPKKVLRKEILVWFQNVSEYMDKLEELVVRYDDVGFFRKALPRLPSEVNEDDYDYPENDIMGDFTTTAAGVGMEQMQMLIPITVRPMESGFIPGSPAPASAPTTPAANSILFHADRFKGYFDEDRLGPSTPTAPQRSSSTTDVASSYTSTDSTLSTPTPPNFRRTSAPIDVTRLPRVNPVQLLSAMRRAFQQTEQKLYTQLAQTHVGTLNDVRRAFLASASGTCKRLLAWQKKHVPQTLPKGAMSAGDSTSFDSCMVDGVRLRSKDPEWWKKGCHAVPGGNVIVRENDWGSIIAFTLGTADYLRELSSMSLTRPPSAASIPSPTLTPSSDRTSFFSSLSGPSAQKKRFFSSSSSARSPDPDDQDVVWHEPLEAYSAVIVRKAHPRDPTSLLSLRDVLRQKNNAAITSTTGPGESTTMARFASLGAAPTAASTIRAKPAPVEVSMHAAGGEVNGLPLADIAGSLGSSGVGASGTADSAAKILQEFDRASVTGSSDASSTHGSLSSSLLDTNIRRGRAASVISVESDATVGGGRKGAEVGPERVIDEVGTTLETSSPPDRTNEQVTATASTRANAPPLPPKDQTPRLPPIMPPTSSGPTTTAPSDTPATPTASGSFFASSLTSTFVNAVRYVLPHSDYTPTSPTPPPKNHHGLLSSTEIPGIIIDERPHIKYDWTIGKRLKFSCTVYYAKQFDLLRRRCGLSDDAFLKSLGKSNNWAAEGGKSKSNFWKTADDRFIIKTLVNAWNVADLQVLLELGPSYFRYMESTAGKPTVLAKLVGFYTIEIRNLESGNVQSKADLLVMENLFYEQNIVKTFDLKGIQGRKAKASGTAPLSAPGLGSTAPGSNKILFDGEWIEGQQRTLTLIRNDSKTILQEAIKSDAEFLAKSNIMDYSLLLGLDVSKKQIACGLVDTIGSYTFAKTLEYKAKQGLNSGKEVTVIPPVEYQERFVNALDGYFVACPDKWSKPADGYDISDVEALPSVL